MKETDSYNWSRLVLKFALIEWEMEQRATRSWLFELRTPLHYNAWPLATREAYTCSDAFFAAHSVFLSFTGWDPYGERPHFDTTKGEFYSGSMGVLRLMLWHTALKDLDTAHAITNPMGRAGR